MKKVMNNKYLPPIKTAWRSSKSVDGQIAIIWKPFQSFSINELASERVVQSQMNYPP